MRANVYHSSTQFISTNVDVSASITTIWDTLTRHFDKDSSLELWKEQLFIYDEQSYRVYVRVSDERECEGVPFCLRLFSLIAMHAWYQF